MLKLSLGVARGGFTSHEVQVKVVLTEKTEQRMTACVTSRRYSPEMAGILPASNKANQERGNTPLLSVVGASGDLTDEDVSLKMMFGTDNVIVVRLY